MHMVTRGQVRQTSAHKLRVHRRRNRLSSSILFYTILSRWSFSRFPHAIVGVGCQFLFSSSSTNSVKMLFQKMCWLPPENIDKCACAAEKWPLLLSQVLRVTTMAAHVNKKRKVCVFRWRTKNLGMLDKFWMVLFFGKADWMLPAGLDDDAIRGFFWLCCECFIVCWRWSLQGWAKRVSHARTGRGWLQWCWGPCHTNQDRDHYPGHQDTECFGWERPSHQGINCCRPKTIQVPRRICWGTSRWHCFRNKN